MNKTIILTIMFVILSISAILWIPSINRPIYTLANISNIISLSSVFDDNIELKKENNQLKEEMFAMHKNFVLPSENDYIGAKVYSLYPFNNKQRFYINIGYKNNLNVGDVVTFGNSVFVGEISKVSPYESEVLTVFDNDFSVAVRIGDEEVGGFMSGGVNPTIKLIDKTKQISVGDSVISASRDIPYGLLIGNISSIDEDKSGAFFNANVRLPYTLSDLRDVNVINSYAKETK